MRLIIQLGDILRNQEVYFVKIQWDFGLGSHLLFSIVFRSLCEKTIFLNNNLEKSIHFSTLKETILLLI